MGFYHTQQNHGAENSAWTSNICHVQTVITSTNLPFMDFILPPLLNKGTRAFNTHPSRLTQKHTPTATCQECHIQCLKCITVRVCVGEEVPVLHLLTYTCLPFLSLPSSSSSEGWNSVHSCSPLFLPWLLGCLWRHKTHFFLSFILHAISVYLIARFFFLKSH